ncbi:MAG: hypothetical protein ACI4S0_10110 [Dorea sp.]
MEEYWNRFMKTGKITDYLYYKETAANVSAVCCGICGKTADSKDTGCCHEGEAIGKSDDTDWHGAGSDTDR